MLAAIGQRAKELGLDMLGGALSGLFLSGANAALNLGQGIQTDGTPADVREYLEPEKKRELDVEAALFPELQEKLDGAGKTRADTKTAAPDGTAESTSKFDELQRISIAEYADIDNPIWNNVLYGDIKLQTRLMRETHQRMVNAGQVVVVPAETLERLSKSYPDLRTMKKSERIPLLKDAMAQLKASLREFLNGLKGYYSFEVNGKTLEARLYDTGVHEVLKKVTEKRLQRCIPVQKCLKTLSIYIVHLTMMITPMCTVGTISIHRYKLVMKL